MLQWQFFLKILTGWCTLENYLRDLKNEYIPWYRKQFDNNNWYWQQDGASIHTSKIVKNYFNEENIAILDWPSKSPDPNIIENLCSILSSLVYDEQLILNNEMLEKKIMSSVKKVKPDTIKKLYNSFRKRVIDVLYNNGEFLDT